MMEFKTRFTVTNATAVTSHNNDQCEYIDFFGGGVPKENNPDHSLIISFNHLAVGEAGCEAIMFSFRGPYPEFTNEVYGELVGTLFIDCNQYLTDAQWGELGIRQAFARGVMDATISEGLKP